MEKLPTEIFVTYFSPHSAHAIFVDGVLYPTLEHAYQSMRYDDLDIKEKIKNAKSPFLAWQISQEYKSLQNENFKNNDHKVKVMFDLSVLKYNQHEDVKKALIDSGDSTIVKHIFNYPPSDGFWDDDVDGSGLNHIGKIWMKIREEIVWKK